MARLGPNSGLFDDPRPKNDYRLVRENDELRRRVDTLERRLDEQNEKLNMLLKLVGKNSFMSFKFDKENEPKRRPILGGDAFDTGRRYDRGGNRDSSINSSIMRAIMMKTKSR